MFLKIRVVAVFGILIGLSSCNEYQNALKSTEIKEKYQLAEKLYNEGDYKRANRLFEQIAPGFVGKPQGERVLFFFANTYYQTRSYSLASFSFDRFVRSYPKSDKLEEASFLDAKSTYFVSPKYSLDQAETDKAITKLQTFINTYPNSEYFEEANNLAQDLNTRKEKKQLEIAKQFNKVGEFNFPILVSAIKALDNFVADNPGSEFREEALYYKMEAATRLALKSTFRKKKVRLTDAKDAYGVLMKYFPESEYGESAKSLLSRVEKELEAYSKLEASLSK